MYQHLLVHIHPERVLIVSVRDIFLQQNRRPFPRAEKKVQKMPSLEKEQGHQECFERQGE